MAVLDEVLVLGPKIFELGWRFDADGFDFCAGEHEAVDFIVRPVDGGKNDGATLHGIDCLEAVGSAWSVERDAEKRVSEVKQEDGRAGEAFGPRAAEQTGDGDSSDSGESRGEIPGVDRALGEFAGEEDASGKKHDDYSNHDAECDGQGPARDL